MKEKIEVQTEFTPNPHSLKFNVNQTLAAKGSVFFEAPQTAKGVSKLAEKIFEIGKIESILIGNQFITVTRTASLDTWWPLIQPVTQVIQDYLQSGEPVVAAGKSETQPQKKPASDVEKRIIQVLDTHVRPAIAKDGGDITFHAFKDGVVTLYLQGSCTTCPSSAATLKAGVQRMLCEYVPEVKEVVQVS